MTEVLVKFSDGFTMAYTPCQSPLAASARVTAWITRYPAAKIREWIYRREILLVDESTGDPTGSRVERAIQVVLIEISEPASPRDRQDCALI